MSDLLQLDYHYGTEAEQYNFYRIPKILFTDRRFKQLCAEAKLLYGLMLDRMALSIKNRWIDSANRVFIYFTLEDAMAFIGCSQSKAIKLFAELDTQKGIGLIDRKKQGQGKPTLIYVKNFTSIPMAKNIKLGSSEVLTCENERSRLIENRGLDFLNTQTNKNNKSDIKISDTESSTYQSKALSQEEAKQGQAKQEQVMQEQVKQKEAKQEQVKAREIEHKIEHKIGEIEKYRALVKENIDYSHLAENKPYDLEEIDGIVELMVETMASTKDTVCIGKEAMPREVVKSRFLKLNSNHIDYVIECIHKNTTKIFNIKAYLLTTLYNACVTMGSYYTALVGYNMYGIRR